MIPNILNLTLIIQKFCITLQSLPMRDASKIRNNN
nr:MAG TPA: hypothetical protein [Caudoviricetes sp.]